MSKKQEVDDAALYVYIFFLSFCCWCCWLEKGCWLRSLVRFS
jgi:hypothetical protein